MLESAVIDAVLISGNEVRLLQSDHVLGNDVAAETLINGNEVSP